MSIWILIILFYYLRLQCPLNVHLDVHNFILLPKTPMYTECPFRIFNVHLKVLNLILLYKTTIQKTPMSIWIFQCPVNVHLDVHNLLLLPKTPIHKTPMSIWIFQCPLGCSLYCLIT